MTRSRMLGAQCRPCLHFRTVCLYGTCISRTLPCWMPSKLGVCLDPNAISQWSPAPTGPTRPRPSSTASLVHPAARSPHAYPCRFPLSISAPGCQRERPFLPLQVAPSVKPCTTPPLPSSFRTRFTSFSRLTPSRIHEQLRPGLHPESNALPRARGQARP